MITSSDIQRLIQRDTNGHTVLSLFLDMSVNSDNKRTHHVFLNKERARFAELESDRENHHREPLGEVLARIDRWIEESYDPTNKGVAIFAELAGDWFEALQFAAPLTNRLELLEHPVIAPLTEVVGAHPRCGIIMVDREHLRLLSMHMGVLGEDYRVEPDAIDSAHDVQAGGYAHKDYQKRKAEETRHFFRDFCDEVIRFDTRARPDVYVLLGTTENTQHFRELQPRNITDRIVHTAHAPLGGPAAEIVRQVQTVLDDLGRRSEAAALNLVQDRVKQSHYAASGFHDTLIQLQEGKVDRLVVARDLEKDGVQCTQCGFYLVQRDGACPYCGGALRDGIDLVESMIRIAANQDVGVDFVSGDTMRDLKGVAALLKF
jgi:peptide subunit release factor 1 (eRF1)